MSTHLPLDPLDLARGGTPVLSTTLPDGRFVVAIPPGLDLPPDITARLKTLGAIVVDGERGLRDTIQRLFPEPAEPVTMPPALPNLGRYQGMIGRYQGVSIEDPHDPAEHATTGIYRDPVSGRVFPPGQAMKRDPNRRERRRLEVWRRTGKAPR